MNTDQNQGQTNQQNNGQAPQQEQQAFMSNQQFATFGNQQQGGAAVSGQFVTGDNNMQQTTPPTVQPSPVTVNPQQATPAPTAPVQAAPAAQPVVNPIAMPTPPVAPMQPPQPMSQQQAIPHAAPAPVPGASGFAQDQSAAQQTGQQPVIEEEEDKTPANYKLGQYIKPTVHIKLPAHQLSFDETHFLELLAGSISLSKDEKKRIIEAIPKLKQQQVDELIRIFTEERNKFSELSGKHVSQLEKLAKQHANEWEDIEMEYAAQTKQQNEAQEADAIRKQLGL